VDAERDGGGEDERGGLLAQKREFIESFFRKGAEFTRELLRENDRLRHRVVQLEHQLSVSSPSASEQTLRELIERMHALEREKDQLLEEFSRAELLERRFESRFEEIERENSDLANLFVAQSQLHASLQVGDVVNVIVEILLNLVGAGVFAVLLRDRDGRPRPIAVHGASAAEVTAVAGAQPDIAAVLRSGARHASVEREDGAGSLAGGLDGDPLVCFPLLAPASGVLGAVTIWGFLPQKDAITDVDRQLFDLLSSSAGSALEAARLCAQRPAERESDGGPFEAYSALLS
jgi:hypothetical protein